MNLSPNSETPQTPDKIAPSLAKPSGPPPASPTGTPAGQPTGQVLGQPSGSPAGAAGLVPPQRVDAAVDAASAPAAGKALKVKKRGGFWKGLGLTLLMGGAASGAYHTQTTHGQKIVKDTGDLLPSLRPVWEAHQNPELIFDQDKSDVVNILLVGRDQNYKQVYDKRGRNIAHAVDNSSPARSDTMIVVSLNRVKKTIRMVSLPRDAMVRMPPNKYDVRLAKLNAAHAYGGVDMLKQTLHDELGLTIQHYAVIKFDGFMKLVDEVNGVYVDVIGALHRDGSRRDLRYTDSWAIPPLDINLKPGKQWLNGKQAHAYVRFRMDLEGDTGRIRRQQGLMRALASRLKTLNPTQIPGVMKMIREQFETDMNDSQLASTGFFAQSLGETSRMQPITLYGAYTERGEAKLNRKKNKALMRTIFGPTFNADNFLQHSPTVSESEFGPDETKPDTREVLREAGLIEGEPRIATTSEDAPSPLVPSGFPATPSSPLGIVPGTSQAGMAPAVAPTPRDPFAFTAPESGEPGRADTERGASERSTSERTEGDAPRASRERASSESASTDEERPRRRRLGVRRTRTTESSSESRSEPRAEEQSPRAAQSEESSPIPQPEGADSGDLNVESPIPQAER